MESTATLSLPNFLPKTRPSSSLSSSANKSKPITVTTCAFKNIKLQAAGTRSTKQSLHKLILKPFHDFIRTFTDDSSLSPFIDPKRLLSGNFSPVDELPPTACEVVEGSLPPSLDGVYIQNGPNPQFFPRGPYHHADGDGMLHSIKISGGEATFCSRFVKTYKYTVESQLGYPVFPNLFAVINDNSRLAGTMMLNLARILRGQFNPVTNGLGPANTSLSLIGGRLYAMMETDLPYEIKLTPDGDIITVGRHDFNSTKKFISMTAHPKIDPETGEAFAYRYFIIPPFLTFFRIDANGVKQKDVPIFSMSAPSFIHDFAVSKNFAIFPDIQIGARPLEIMRGGSILSVDHEKIPRLGIIPRYADDDREMYWMEIPGFNMLHAVNAWEEDDGSGRIVVLATNLLSIEHALENLDLVHLSMEKITIDAKEKKIVSRHSVSPRSLDFGVINPQYAGKKNRYVYASAIETLPKMTGVVKIDLSLSAADCTVASRLYGPGCYGSEPIFVAAEPNNPAAAEDDGYLLSYVHNENTKESHFLVMDAKSPTLETVAAVKLPGRVTHGFHSIFVKQSDLRSISEIND